MKIIDLTKDSFVEKVADYQSYPDNWNFKGNKPCLVDFHAPWCVYCKALSPILDQLAKEYEGKLDIYKVDVDQEPELESAFKIRTCCAHIPPVSRRKKEIRNTLFITIFIFMTLL